MHICAHQKVRGGFPLLLVKRMEYIRLWSIRDKVVDELFKLLRVFIYERIQNKCRF